MTLRLRRPIVRLALAASFLFLAAWGFSEAQAKPGKKGKDSGDAAEAGPSFTASELVEPLSATGSFVPEPPPAVESICIESGCLPAAPAGWRAAGSPAKFILCRESCAAAARGTKGESGCVLHMP